jgi:hypothetical protein
MSETQMQVLAIVAIVAIVAISIGCVWLWVLSLVNAAKAGKWVWFIMMLIFAFLCVFYLLLAYERTPRRMTFGDRVEPRW